MLNAMVRLVEHENSFKTSRPGFIVYCRYVQRKIQSELPRRIPWNQTSDVHRGSTLIT